MATLLKESTFSGSGGSHFKARLEYSYTQDQVNNKTTITYILKMVSQDGWSGSGAANSITGYIGGTSSSDKVGNASKIGVNSTITIGSRSYTITHNADGTFPSQSYSARIDCGWNGVNRADISGTLSGLPTIPRDFTTKPTLTYVSATETEMSFTWATSEACSKAILYKDGTAIITQSSLNTTSGSFNATGLTAGTESVYYVKCTRKDSSRDMNSDSQNRATYAYPYVQSIGTPQITLPVPSTLTISQTITLYNPLNRTNVTVYAKKDNSSGTEFAHASNSAGTPGSVTLSLSTSTMYNSIPSATSGTVAYYCIYNDGSDHQSGNTTGTFITTANNCGPTVSANPTYTNTNNAHVNIVGASNIIQGQSSFSVTAPAATARGSASISKYYFKIGNGSYENNNNNREKAYTSTSSSEDVTIYCYAEDSRGYTTEVKQATMKVLSYSAPAVDISVARDSGYATTATITLNSAKRSVLYLGNDRTTDVNAWCGNIVENKISLEFSSSSPPGPLLHADYIGGTGAILSTDTVNISNASTSSSYTIEVNISDKITTKTLNIILNKAIPIVSMNAVSSAVGVGVMVGDNTTDKLTVVGSTNITSGNLSVSGNTSVGGTLSSTGALSTSNNLSVTGTSTLTGNVTATNNISVGGNLTVTGTLNASNQNDVVGYINGVETKTNAMYNYSTSEIRIGTWMDKPLYRKVVEYTNTSTIGAVGSETVIDVAHGISNLGIVWLEKGFTSDGRDIPFFNGTNSLSNGVCVPIINSTNIRLRIVNNSWGTRTWYFILRYTKTTD